MGPVPHGRATATEVLRRAIQHNHESLRGLTRRYTINQKTVPKRKKQTSTADLPKGPKKPHPTMLSRKDDAVIAALSPPVSLGSTVRRENGLAV